MVIDSYSGPQNAVYFVFVHADSRQLAEPLFAVVYLKSQILFRDVFVQVFHGLILCGPFSESTDKTRQNTTKTDKRKRPEMAFSGRKEETNIITTIYGKRSD